MTGSMKIAICHGRHAVDVESRPLPPLGNGQVLIRVSLCGLCGSDLGVWGGDSHMAYPYSPGHEFCGTVEEAGSSVTGLASGQRVVVDPNLGCGRCRYCGNGKPNLCDNLKGRSVRSNGGLAEYVAADHRMVHALPDALSDATATLVEPLSCAIHVARVADIPHGVRVAIFGAGTLGLLTGLALEQTSCELLVVEPLASRRDQAEALLGCRAIEPRDLEPSHGPDAFDICVDCSGRAEAVRQAFTVLPKAGRLVLAGLASQGEEIGIPLAEVTRKELDLRGAWLNPHTFSEALRLAEQLRERLDTIPWEVLPLDRVRHAFERAATREGGRVLVKGT